MSRRRAAEKRKINPDAKYGDLIVAKFINCMMKQGKKSVAEKAMYDAFEIVEQKAKKDPLELFLEAIKNVMPSVEVRSRRVGGATYQVPTEVRDVRRMALAIKWLINAARSRNEKTIREKLAAELMEAFNGRGSAVKKREDTHKMAEANRAFSHYRF
jgi:small subunit ribosomal protein S7